MMRLPRRGCCWIALWLGLALSASAQEGVVLNEIAPDNESLLQDEDGAFSDWIELHNAGPTAINLDGFWLTDDPDNLTGWRFGAVTVPPGGFLIVFASDKDRADPGGELHTSFKLNNGGEYLALVAPDGVTVVSEFAPGFPPIGSDGTYGRGAGDGALGLLNQPTPGAPNSAVAMPPAILSFTADVTAIPHGGTVTLSWEVANATRVSIAPGPQGLPLAGSLVVQPDQTRTYRIDASNALGVVGDAIRIEVGPELRSFEIVPPVIVPGGSVWLKWDAFHATSARLDDGFGPVPIEPILYTPFNELLVGPGSTWRFLGDGSDQGTAWRAPGFDDAAWSEGGGRFGYGAGGGFETEVPRNGVTSYFRHEFTVANPADHRGGRLRLSTRAGAVAYLNGVEIARHHIPAGIAVDFETIALRPSIYSAGERFLEFEFDPARLLSGSNVLAVEVHGAGPTPSSMSFDAGLTTWRLGGPGQATLELTLGTSAAEAAASAGVVINGDPAPPAPPPLAITEYLINVDGAFLITPFRFIEILNVGDAPVDLGQGPLIYGAVFFDLSGATQQVLAPGEYALLVADAARFREAWGQGFPVIGEFGTAENFHLSEQLGLLSGDGQLIETVPLQFAPGGGGFRTWERIDAAAPPLLENWRESPNSAGSPGEREVPSISIFGDLPIMVRAGDLVTLTWTVEAAQSVRIEPGLGEFTPSPFYQSTQVRILPGEGSRNYEIVATGQHATVRKTIPVIVRPGINAFTASPNSVTLGEPVTLRWDVFGADTDVELSGFGDVTGLDEITVYPSRRELIPRRSEWSYLNDGSNQGTRWKEPAFDDAAWNRGEGILGYGNQTETTIVEQGFAMNYFRRTFEIADPDEYEALFVDLLIDDGAQVFLNGDEVLRENLPEGEIGYQTLSVRSAPTDGREYVRFPVDHTQLVAGTNTIAVGAHNNWEFSDDYAFDLGLVGIATDADGLWSFLLTARNAAGRVQARVTVGVAGPPISFSDWATGAGIPGAPPDGDEDGDGLKNELEAALGLSPTAIDSINPLSVTIGIDGRLLLDHPNDPSTEASSRLAVEVSRDLDRWVPATGELQLYGAHTVDGKPWVLRQTYLPVGAFDGALFFRLALRE